MAARLRRYPIGIQTFSEIRGGGYVYVDKTGFISRLANESGKTFFLSRPRRFGKSLLLSTMQAYFEGRRELFDGLAADEPEHEWESQPVIRVDLSTVKTKDPQVLTDLLNFALSMSEGAFGRDPEAKTPGSRLMGLIRRAYEHTGKRVVLLVDEYDAPILNVVDDPVNLEAFRLTMREFFAPIKACDPWLRLTFITGITKFSQLSIFSELNNLRNISMEPGYSALCGITEEELLTQFAPDVDLLADRLRISTDEAFSQLKAYYDGYHFSRESPDIYNPFSLLTAFAKGALVSSWFGSGTPTFLLDLLARHDWDIAHLDGTVAAASSFDAAVEQMVTPLPMLYQSGYLTIKDYDAPNDSYVLGIPNREVSQGLSECLVARAAPTALDDHNLFLNGMANHLRSGEVEKALEELRIYLAGIPYDLGSKDERGFETTFFLIFDLLGAKVQTEFKTATGRIDAVVRTTAGTFVFEFKYDKSAAEALAQIDRKDYPLSFKAQHGSLYKVGVNYSSVERTIDEWVVKRA